LNDGPGAGKIERRTMDKEWLTLLSNLGGTGILGLIAYWLVKVQVPKMYEDHARERAVTEANNRRERREDLDRYLESLEKQRADFKEILVRQHDDMLNRQSEMMEQKFRVQK
jgi:hypothetical protein